MHPGITAFTQLKALAHWGILQTTFFAFIDNLTTELLGYFSGEGLTTYSKLENILLSGQVDDTLLQNYTEISRDDLSLQLAMFHGRCHDVKTLSRAVSILYSVAPEVRELFSEVEKLVRLLLVCPCASAEAERSFSALRRLKTWLRSTMTQSRLNSVAICHVPS